MKTLSTLTLLILAAFATSGCGGGATPAEATEHPGEKPLALSFELVIEGIELAVPVIGVSGLGTETVVVDRPDGNEETPDKSPGATSASNIVLERGYTATDDFWEWRKEIEGGTVVRRSGSLTVRNAAGDTVATYNLIDAWPTSWNVGPVTTLSDQLTESITLVCERIQRVVR